MSLDRNGTGTSQGASGNQRGGSGEGMGGRGGGRNDGNSSKSIAKSSPPKATSPATPVSSRIASVSKTLSSYNKSSVASTPGYAKAGYGDTLNAQRNQLAGPVSGGGPSSLGGAASYGMQQEAFDKSINTDNLNGVIGNLQGKAQRDTLSEVDRHAIARATGDYNALRGAGVLGNMLVGTPGKWGAQQLAGAAMDEPGDYLSGMARKAATGQLDDGRLVGQRDQLGDGGTLDTILQGALSLAGMTLPGAGLVTGGISSGLTTAAPGFGGVLNNLNDQAGNGTGQGQEGSGSDKDYAAPTRPGIPKNSTDGTLAFDSHYYDPSRYNVSAGRRGY